MFESTLVQKSSFYMHACEFRMYKYLTSVCQDEWCNFLSFHCSHFSLNYSTSELSNGIKTILKMYWLHLKTPNLVEFAIHYLDKPNIKIISFDNTGLCKQLPFLKISNLWVIFFTEASTKIVLMTVKLHLFGFIIIGALGHSANLFSRKTINKNSYCLDFYLAHMRPVRCTCATKINSPCCRVKDTRFN